MIKGRVIVMFKISNDLQNAIDSHDTKAGKNAILCYLDSDPRNRTGDTEKALHYATTQGLNVFAEHNPAIKMEQDRTKWNDDYIVYTSVGLFRNFSKERFEHWKEVADYVRKKMDAHATPSVQQKQPYYNSTVIGSSDGKNVESPHSVNPALVVGVIAAIVVDGAVVVITLKI